MTPASLPAGPEPIITVAPDDGPEEARRFRVWIQETLISQGSISSEEIRREAVRRGLLPPLRVEVIDDWGAYGTARSVLVPD